MESEKFDFSGYATRNGLRCSDGRTIMHNAFKDMDGQKVPLVWQHQHGSADNVLGHAILENRDDGVYCYASLNDTDMGQKARALIEHGDVEALSIYANRLVEQNHNVTHGVIREVSLVLAGANPGAFIDNIIQHSDDGDILGAVITSGADLVHEEGYLEPLYDEDLYHEDQEEDDEDDDSEETVKDVYDSFSDDQKSVLAYIIGVAVQGDSGDSSESVSHADEEESDGGPSVKEVFDSLSEKQKQVAYYLIGNAVDDAKKSGGQGSSASSQNGSNSAENVQHQDSDEGEIMAHSNLFEQQGAVSKSRLDTQGFNDLWHDALEDGQMYGSLKKSFEAHVKKNTNIQHSEDIFSDISSGAIQHADTSKYGIGNIDNFFPDYQAVSDKPAMLDRKQDWVGEFMGGLHRTPFARIKSLIADITEDEARAKGYIKGNLKKEEFFSTLKRTTDPQTVYKKQKLDRDDILDVDFDVVAWLKVEMMGKLQEEVARAILVGDGRPGSSDDKIKEEHIRPVWTDDEIYTVHRTVEAAVVTDNDRRDEIVDEFISAQDDYLGNGTPTLYAAPSLVTSMLLIKDGFKRRVYNNLADLASALGVAKVVKVPVMKGLSRTVTLAGGATQKRDLVAIMMNPADYTLGTKKGGETTFFDDFDIDYNQQKYLYETRLSGALTLPSSAVVLEAPKA